MHFPALIFAALSATLVVASPLIARSDYTSCLDICSGDYSQCLTTDPGNEVVVLGVISLCNAQALACESTVCATTQDIELVIENGLPEVTELLTAAGKEA